MSEFIINSTDAPTLDALAQGMGFWSATSDRIATQGPIPGDPNPMASYFLNIIGAIPDAPGYWCRLRINGTSPFADGLLAIPTGIMIYAPVEPADGSASFWSADGVTPAPSFVAGIGVIA
jgi:hypothetical protein